MKQDTRFQLVQNAPLVDVNYSTSAMDPKKTLVVLCSQSNPKDKKSKTKLNIHSSQKEIKDVINQLNTDNLFSGKHGETYFYPRINKESFESILTVGLGPQSDLTHEAVRRAIAAAYKVLKSNKITNFVITIGSNFPRSLDTQDLARALAEGIQLSSYNFNELKSDDKKEKNVLKISLHIESASQKKSIQSGWEIGTCMAIAINFARRLGDMPGNLMTPSILADTVQTAGKKVGLKVSVWDKARIKKEKMGCLAGVSNGSKEEPRLIIMEYNGGGKGKKPVCFVGKGLTFDSGGISLKPSANMEEMKYDMCGGAATIGTLLAIAMLNLKINVIGIVPSSENMPGPAATKPGDIHVARNGKSVEINNTDAEGRLILADALSYASELTPGFIVDAATLTGAMVVALGDLHTGYFCRDEKLNKVIQKASEASGETLWRLPLIKEHCDDMKGTYADLSNMANNKGAGSAHGAGFLDFFVEKSIPWAHFDIAGTAYHIGHRVPYHPKRGASGIAVRTFVELAKAWA